MWEQMISSISHFLHIKLYVPLNSRLSRFVTENLLDMRDISTLCSLQKILLFPHLAWVREKGLPSFTNQLLFVYKVCHSHFVLRFWLVSYQSVIVVIVQRGHARVPHFSLRSSSATRNRAAKLLSYLYQNI